MQTAIWKVYALFIALTEAVGVLSGYLTKEGTKAYALYAVKPKFTPPGSVFPVVWGILYALMGIGAAKIWYEASSVYRTISLIVFAVQLAANFCWSILFFNVRMYGFALLWLIFLWGLIVLMIYMFFQVNKSAAYLQIPYFVWVSFAASLNFMVWQLN